MIDYKKTLNLPHTKFPMRANLPVLEPKILDRWYTDNVYDIIRDKKSKKRFFLLHDGPPYANGKIHLGHAVNKILKDIIIKFHGLSGYNAPYIPGWDCHGLPIELKVEQLIKNTNSYVNTQDFQNMCRQYAAQQIETQKQDFIRLGVIGDWNRSYLTMNFQVEADIIRNLSKIIANGYIYKGIKPVHWCFKCSSALAISEVEYQNHSSYAVDIGFAIVEKWRINTIFRTDLCIQNVELIIWTTTLWTIPANYAISVHPDYVYQLIEILDNRYIIIAANLVKTFMNRLKCFSWKILGESLGKDLEYLKVSHPFMSFVVPVILSKHITLDAGTGVVHIAPHHGLDDYILAKKYNINDITDFIDDKGYYLSNTHFSLQGKHIFQSKYAIIALLIKSNNILCVDSNYQHSYPYCWRHKTPLILRATSQWFFNMHHNNFKNKLLQVIQKVSWISKQGYSNIKSMIINRPDWCISRQRTWGIPIPILIHKKTEDFHPNTFELIEKIAQLVEKHGIQVWQNIKIEDLLSKNEAVYYKKIYDTLDVWFDSGSTYNTIVLKNFPFLGKNGVDLYLEGSDQYRGWFMSSLVIAVAVDESIPYQQVLSHGFTVDATGSKMSKSIGNIISPQDIINQFGSDVLRLWVASSDYIKEMAISTKVLQHVSDIYRRIRNTIRFFLANLHDFNPQTDIVEPKKMIELDRWAVDQALNTQLKIISNYKKYQFHNVIKYIMRFCSIDMSSFYLNVIKDRQYTFQQKSLARRSCQTALYHITEAVVRWIAPILSFTSDEIWQYIPGKRSQYVFTEEWYDGLFKLDSNQFMTRENWKVFFNIKDKINKQIEEARVDGVIKESLEAHIVLYINTKLADQLRVLNHELAFGLLVASIVIVDYDDTCMPDQQHINDNGEINLKIVLTKTKGVKCLRCWNYTAYVNQYQNYLDLCSKCLQNIVGVGENRKYF